MTTTSSTSTNDTLFRQVRDMIARDPGALATLRRNVGRSFDESPDSWPYVLMVTGRSRWREPAAHLALGLFALHHQSKTPGALDKEGSTFGLATRRLRTSRGDSGASEQGIERRFRSALASETIDALGVHLRGLVTLMRGADVSLDYPRLYQDLSTWLLPEKLQRVSLRWARDYYALDPDQQSPAEQKEEP
ncbi:CRISPR-associated protein, Cse2 family [Acidimicrobium ferrooxidans DSM 10331]|uniref:CRISPR-associated protein, Cse2 family n=1 Tax=Acidimicrobium ferrooxidans (strain DSM 10331 / JCM 15462 / NBRC 103882 / ICP) TaxID=525909 RepID=C7LYW8_ACIFD|nr:type I-E CRISPR-associated protein Cse2/CasB [Acidimicrobium ferrooxidans]ACU53926.1 CRISPR-associated protein, Cse2 family [Acidimicrobium ferrooxidans DSM 10331]